MKTIKAAAVSAALLPAAAFAAVDDQGMQYVSGAEGLSGSLRVMIIESIDNDTDIDDLQLGKENSLRLYYQGDADLGGGLSATYYWELRNGGDGIFVHAYDIGLSGAFGDFEVGKLGESSLRMVPGGSLDNIYGNSRSFIGGDPSDNGVRYETPSINGFKAGFTLIGQALTYDHDDNADTAEVLREDEIADALSFGVKYELPIGMWVGIGHDLVESDTETSDDISGYNLGARYSRDNWKVTYEFRSYEGHAPIASYGNSAKNTFDENDEYSVHGFGVSVSLDRITVTANYSSEEQTKGGDFNGAADGGAYPDVSRETFASDVIYALGSRATIGAGVHSQDTESHVLNAAGDDVATSDSESTKVGVYYRVDF